MYIEGAEPFLLMGGRRGVLLVHGFTGNPAEMRLLGEQLNSLGFTVLAVRLAGHGTVVQDMGRTTKDDWLTSVRDGYQLLKGLVDDIAIVGHSMGALLTLLISLEVKTDRLVLLAPPIFIAPEQGLSQLPPRKSSVGQYAPKSRRQLPNVPPAANDTYSLMPLTAIHELLEVIEEVQQSIRKVTVPLLLIHGKSDHTADSSSSQYIYDNVASAAKEIIFLDDAGHLLPLDVGTREIVFERIERFLTKSGDGEVANSYCFGCSHTNPIGIKLDFTVHEGHFVATKTLPREYQSYDGIVHGGIVITMLDEAMGGLLYARGEHAVTARLEVRFRKETPILVPLRIEGWIEERRRSLVDTKAIVKIADTGEITAEASARLAVLIHQE